MIILSKCHSNQPDAAAIFWLKVDWPLCPAVQRGISPKYYPFCSCSVKHAALRCSWIRRFAKIVVCSETSQFEKMKFGSTSQNVKMVRKSSEYAETQMPHKHICVDFIDDVIDFDS